MESNDSDIYVAKLLEQLEQLKKKKARRLKKLKKLGTVNEKDVASTSAGNESALSPLQSIQNDPLSARIEEKENITDLKCSNSSFLNSSVHICTAKKLCNNVTKTDNSSSSLNFESDSNNACPHKSVTNSTVNNGPESPIKRTQSNQSKDGSNLFSGNSDGDERLNENMKPLSFSLNRPINGVEEGQRKMRKRSTSEISETEENSVVENTKKFKLSEDAQDHTGTSSEQVSQTKDISSQNNFVLGKIEQPFNSINGKNGNLLKLSDDSNEDSLSHNMTCFMSCNLFIGEEDNGNFAVIEKSSKCGDSTGLIPNPEKNVPNVLSVTNCRNNMLSSSATFEKNDQEVSDSTKSSNEQIDEHPIKTILEAKHNGDSSHVSNVTLHSIKGLETIESPDSPVEIVKTSNAQILDNLCDTHDILPVANKIECAVSAIKSYDNLSDQNVLPTQNTEDKNSSMPTKLDSHTSFDSQDAFNTWPENDTLWENVKNENEVDENQTPSLLESAVTHSLQTEKNICFEEYKTVNVDPVDHNFIGVQTIDISDDGLVDDALTADIDFNSSMSLEVSDTADSLLNESSKEQIAASLSSHNGHLMQEQYIQADTNVEDNTEACVLDTEIFTIPETEFFESSHSSEVDTVIENKACFKKPLKPYSNPSKSIDSKEPILDGGVANTLQTFEQFTSKCTENPNEGNFVFEQFSETLCGTLDQLHTVQETLLLEAEDTQDMGNQNNFPLTEKFCIEKCSLNDKEIKGDSQAPVTLTHSFHSDIGETVQNIKFVDFSHSSYIFIQHITWIQIWRQDENKEWTKVFSHYVGDKLLLKDICCSADSDYLILVMLLKSDAMYCLQFLLFEKERKVIKLMEHTHWLTNKCSENSILLCGLEGLKFAVAQGNEDKFEVFVHVFNCLEENPRLLTAVLGSTDGCLKSLCSIEKLPNALMGTSESTLYVWHVLEARLVTSVNLQSSDPLFIENCIWATIENGLVFFMAVCKTDDSSQGCELLAANLATGFCQRVMVYSLRPARDTATFPDKNIKATYKEPFLALTCEEGAFLWCATNEYCCAALDKDADVTALALHRDGDIVSVVVGNRAGCANSYNIHCS